MIRQIKMLLMFLSLIVIGNSTVHGQSVILFAPNGSTTTYLMDENEEIIKTWESSYRPGQACYLLDDKSLLRTGSVGRLSNSIFGATGGAGGVVEHYDWDGNKMWSFEYSSDNYLLHHDVEYLPNGNILMIAWERKTKAEVLAAGRNPSLLTAGELWPDKIFEFEPNGSSGGNIVWEWHVWDHLIQDYDASKPNYGTVSDESGKIDLNFVLGSGADWNHTNAVDYNEDLDQIMITVHNFSEIWIIDHNTTTEQAAGTAGDLLYRWGNPQAYGRGNSTDQQLFVPHNGQWIESGYPGENDILVFNNGQNRQDGNYSTVDQITPTVNGSGEYSLSNGSAFGPSGLSWTYRADPLTSFYAKNISGAQRLPDGNTLICDRPAGTFFRVTPEGETVWEYVNPFLTNGPQGESNAVFRAVHYDLDNLGGDDPPYAGDMTYPIVDTGQKIYYNNSSEISAPSTGEAFYGQDAQYSENQPSYTDNGDGTVTDNVSGLMWQKSPDGNGDGIVNYVDKLLYDEAVDSAASCNLAGYNDWRLPTIKEQYSLITYYGAEPNPMATSQGSAVPYIDTDYFDFGYGDLSVERIIDAQYATSTIYVSTTMGGNKTMFGVNFADGRIKGYPAEGPMWKRYYVMYVRGNTKYGKNEYEDNGDGTITDKATGLMWIQNDNGEGVLWEDALNYAKSFEYAGYADWRLPNAKELQSIVDYTRSPSTSSSAAIDSMFNCTQITNEAGETDYPFYWTSTTFCSQSTARGTDAVYISFGRAMGYMNGSWIDVHGAGCQRSDPKAGDPADYPTGHGPQGDAIRIYNYVRLVRGADNTTNVGQSSFDESILPGEFDLGQNYPNPFNPETTISFRVPEAGKISLKIYNVLGENVATIVEEYLTAGNYSYKWQPQHQPSGLYYYTLKSGSFSETKKMLLVR
jgi:hypothetical protein